MSKNTAQGQPESTLPEGHSGSTDDVQVLQARIDELEKQLRYEKMRDEAYNTMIDLAEDASNLESKIQVVLNRMLTIPQKYVLRRMLTAEPAG